MATPREPEPGEERTDESAPTTTDDDRAEPRPAGGWDETEPSPHQGEEGTEPDA